MSDRLLTVAHAAGQLDVSPMTVYRLVYAHQLTAVPVGLGKSRPRIRIRESELTAFMARGSKTPPSTPPPSRPPAQPRQPPAAPRTPPPPAGPKTGAAA